MKNLKFIILFFLFTGCYTQLRVIVPDSRETVEVVSISPYRSYSFVSVDYCSRYFSNEFLYRSCLRKYFQPNPFYTPYLPPNYIFYTPPVKPSSRPIYTGPRSSGTSKRPSESISRNNNPRPTGRTPENVNRNTQTNQPRNFRPTRKESSRTETPRTGRSTGTEERTRSQERSKSRGGNNS